MTTKYVSVSRGDDTTGDGSAATPWKTIAKAVGNVSPAFTLDTINPNTLYVEPGVYRESILLGVAPASAGPLSIVGDVDGAGFAAGGYATPATGLVDWRAWTDDHTPIGGACLSANANHNYVTLQKIKFIGGSFASGLITIDSSHDWTLRDCNFIGYYGASLGVIIYITPAAGVPLNLTVDRCRFHSLGGGGTFNFVVPLNATDWSMASSITNCVIEGSDTGVYYFQQFGTGSFYAGGLTVQNCTFIGPAYGVYVGGPATSSPVTVYGCVFAGGIVHADTAGQITENGNIFMQHTANEAVTAGANSITAACPAFNLGDERLTGQPARPYAEPAAVSPFNGFGSYGTTPTVDITGRNRPEGAASIVSSCGAYERHDTGTKDTTYQDAGSSACLKLVGPSSQEQLVLVDAVATTLSVKVRWDGNHGDANKPQAILVAEPAIGVTGQTLTATSAGGTGTTPNSYETLTFSGFTPTAKGAVRLRLASRAAAGNGVAYFDSIGV